MNSPSHLIHFSLLAVGVAGLAVLTPKLKSEGKLEQQPNVLHLKGSPYGRTLALAMRGPVDVFWHRGAVHDHGDGHDHSHADHECGPECSHEDHDHHDHHHHEVGEHGHNHDFNFGPTEEESLGARLRNLAAKDKKEAEETANAAQSAPAKGGMRTYLLDRIDGMRTAYYSRSNTRTESPRHKAYVMGEVERRLALSYQMDPTNLACYGSYFLFLSEALARLEGSKGEDGAITVRQQAALNLSNYTVQYCLRHQDEAPAMMTAANAAHDYLQIHLAQPQPDLKVAASFLQIMDGSLQRYESLREQMITEGTWENFSIHRRSEMERAHALVRILRDADHQLFGELSNTARVSAGEEPKS